MRSASRARIPSRPGSPTLRPVARPLLCALLFAMPAGSSVEAQEFTYAADFGFAGLTALPAALQPACGGAHGLGPSVRGYYRPHRIISAELTLSAAFAFGEEEATDCGAIWPLEPGRTITRRYMDGTAHAVSPGLEGRIVLTPVSGNGSRLRLIGGGIAFPMQRAFGWLVGGGFMGATQWGAWTFDVERWRVGSGYTLHQITGVEPFGRMTSEQIGEGREWMTLWHLRLGFVVLMR